MKGRDPRLSNARHADTLAWSIVENIALYHADAVERAVAEQQFYTLLADEIAEGRAQFVARVVPALVAEGIFEKAVETWRRALFIRAGLEQPDPPQS